MNRRRLAGSIAKGSFVIGLSSIICKFLALIFILLVLWYVPNHEAGIFFIGTALIGLVTLIPSLGIPASLTRFIAYFIGKKKFEKVWPTFKELTILMFIVSVITATIFFLNSEEISNFYNEEIGDVLVLIIIGSPFILIHPANIAYIRGLRKFGVTAIFNFIFMSVQIIVFLYFIFYIEEPTAYNAIFSKLISYVVVLILEFVFIIYSSIDYIKKSGKKLTLEDYKDFFSYGIPLYLSTYGSYLANWTDTLVLGHYVNSSFVAGYSAMSMAARNIGYFVSIVLSTVLDPTMAYLLGRGDEKNAVKVGTHATKWYIAMSTPLLLAALIFPRQIINLVLPNSGYAQYYYLLYVLAPTFYMITLSAAYKSMLWAKGRTDVFLKVSGIIVIPNIILNFILIPIFGLIGAAFATAIAFISAELLYIREGRKYGIKYHCDVMNIILINIILGVLLYAINYLFDLATAEMIIVGTVFALVYAVLLYLFKIIKMSDIDLIIKRT